MTKVKRITDFDRVQSFVDYVLWRWKTEKDAGRASAEHGIILINLSNAVRYSVLRDLKNTRKARIPALINDVLTGTSLNTEYGIWTFVDHDSPDYAFVQLPPAETQVMKLSWGIGDEVRAGDVDLLAVEYEDEDEDENGDDAEYDDPESDGDDEEEEEEDSEEEESAAAIASMMAKHSSVEEGREYTLSQLLDLVAVDYPWARWDAITSDMRSAVCKAFDAEVLNKRTSWEWNVVGENAVGETLYVFTAK